MPEPFLSGSAYLRLVGLGAVIGIPAVFLAALFLAVVHDVEHWLWDSLPSSLGHSAPPWRPYNGTDVYDLIVAVVVGVVAPRVDRRVAAKATQEAGLPVAEPG